MTPYAMSVFEVCLGKLFQLHQFIAGDGDTVSQHEHNHEHDHIHVNPSIPPFQLCAFEVCSKKHFNGHGHHGEHGPEGVEHVHPHAPFAQNLYECFFPRHAHH